VRSCHLKSHLRSLHLFSLDAHKAYMHVTSLTHGKILQFKEPFKEPIYMQRTCIQGLRIVRSQSHRRSCHLRGYLRILHSCSLHAFKACMHARSLLNRKILPFKEPFEEPTKPIRVSRRHAHARTHTHVCRCNCTRT